MSGLTHLFGAFLGVGGYFFLANRIPETADWVYKVSIVAFAASLVLLYLSSSAYHLLHVSNERQRLLRQIDHSMIFVFIAGSYTPFCLIALKGSIGIALLIGVWAIAISGVIVKVFWINGPRWPSTLLYIAQGWIVVVAIIPLIKAVSLPCLLWLVAGGVAYTGGSVIYALKRPDPFPPYFGFHEIWHLFVLAGSFCHFISVTMLVA